MSELQAIQQTLVRAARRRRWQRAWHGMWRGLFAGAIAWMLTIATYKLVPIPQYAFFAAGIFAVVALLTGFFYGWMHNPSIEATARWLDEQQKLQERLSTALEVASAGKNENWRPLLINDAAR